MQYDDVPVEDKPKETTKLDTWNRRRKIVYITLLYCAVSITYLMVLGDDTRLNETIANGLLLLASSTILYYIAGSVVDDYKSRRR